MEAVLKNVFSLFGARSEDQRKIFLMVPVFFLCGIAEIMNYNGFMTMFNSRLGVEFLPYVYGAEAFIIPLEGLFMSWLTNRLAKPQLMRALYLIMTGLVLANAAVLAILYAGDWSPGWYYPVLFLTSNFVVRQQTILLWSYAVDLCPTQQAKRLMPLFVSVATLGGAAGGLFSQWGNMLQGPQLVYGVAPLLMLVAYQFYRKGIARFLAPLVLGHAQTAEIPAEELTTKAYFFGSFRSRFLLSAIALMTLMPALYFLMEYQYMTVAKAAFGSEEALGAFYGKITMLLFLAAFLLQIVFGRLLNWLGASNLLVVISGVFLGGFLLVSALIDSSLALIAVSIGYIFLYLLLYYFAEPAYQLFFKTLPLAQRDGYRYMVQGIATSTGILLGSLLQFGHSLGLLALRPQAFIGVAGAVLLVAIAWYGRRLYLHELLKGVQQLHATSMELVASLGEFMRDSRALAAVNRLLEHPNVHAREVALELIGSTREKSYLPRLLDMMEDGSPRIRIASLRAMNLQGADMQALAKVASFLQDNDFTVRAEGVRQLGKAVHAKHQVFYFIRELFADPHPSVVAEAVNAMHALGIEQGREEGDAAISRLLGQGPEASIHACEAIAACRLRSFVPQVEGLLTNAVPAVRIAAIRCLGVLEHAAAVPMLLKLLPQADTEVRRAIVEALVNMGKPSVPVLMQALSNAHPLVWNAAASSLASLQDEEAIRMRLVPACIGRLFELQEEKRLVAALQAGGLAELEKLARQRLLEIRAVMIDAAWTILARLSDEQVIEPVRRAIESDDEDIHENGLEVLAEGIGDRRLASAVLQIIQNWNDVTPIESAAEAAAVWKQAAFWPDDWLQEIARAAKRWGEVREVNEERSTLGILDKIIFLKEVSFFSDLTVEELGVIAKAAVEEVHQDHTFLVRRGELNPTIYAIIEGHVELSSMTANGQEGTIGILGPRDVFGETSALEGIRSNITAQALLGEVRLLALRAEDVSRLIRLYPEIGIRLLRTSFSRIRLLEEMIMRMDA